MNHRLEKPSVLRDDSQTRRSLEQEKSNVSLTAGFMCEIPQKNINGSEVASLSFLQPRVRNSSLTRYPPAKKIQPSRYHQKLIIYSRRRVIRRSALTKRWYFIPARKQVRTLNIQMHINHTPNYIFEKYSALFPLTIVLLQSHKLLTSFILQRARTFEIDFLQKNIKEF